MNPPTPHSSTPHSSTSNPATPNASPTNAALSETPAAQAGPWLVVVDPQRIFADPASDWGSPMWGGALLRIADLIDHFESAHDGRVIITRWVPPQPHSSQRSGSWQGYMQAWPFADRPAQDPMFEVVPELAGAAARHRGVASHTFGKYGAALEAITGPTPQLVVCGVSTDCCVISTALPAADAGATVQVVSDACAGSTPDNHAKALDVMELYPPQIVLRTTAQILSGDAAAGDTGRDG